MSTRLSSLLRVAQGERLRRHAAERQADEMRLGDAERVEQAGEVVGEVLDAGRAVDHLRAAVPARVVAQAAGSDRLSARTCASHISSVAPTDVEKTTTGASSGPVRS